MTMCLPQRIYLSHMPRKLASKWFSWQSNILSDCKGPKYLCLQLKRVEEWGREKERERKMNSTHLKTQEKENLFIKSREMQCEGSWLSYRKKKWREKVKKRVRERERDGERLTSDFRNGPTAETTDCYTVGCHRNGDRRLCVNCLHIDWNECVRLDCSGISSNKYIVNLLFRPQLNTATPFIRIWPVCLIKIPHCIVSYHDHMIYINGFTEMWEVLSYNTLVCVIYCNWSVISLNLVTNNIHGVLH